MNENWTMRLKRERLDRCVEIVKALGKVSFARASATIEMNIGVTKEKADGYLRTLLLNEALKMENGEVSVA